MQSIAAEMNFSETTFVLPADRPDADMRLRIFTPAGELPIAGHPTIGSAFALARTGAIEPGRAQVIHRRIRNELGDVVRSLTA